MSLLKCPILFIQRLVDPHARATESLRHTHGVGRIDQSSRAGSALVPLIVELDPPENRDGLALPDWERLPLIAQKHAALRGHCPGTGCIFLPVQRKIHILTPLFLILFLFLFLFLCLRPVPGLLQHLREKYPCGQLPANRVSRVPETPSSTGTTRTGATFQLTVLTP